MIASLSAVCAAFIAGVAAAQGSPGTPANQCRVSVDRSAGAGTFDVVRQEFDNGRCVCAVTTGPTSQPALIEGRISSILSSRTCADARSVAMAGQSGTAVAVPLALAASGAVIGGIILASDEDRPVSP
ncbi:MAG: hypothetical protein V2I74_13130 [Erythrobacter sp.]|nr:hypothetical protein [Erythrobacter sp.]